MKRALYFMLGVIVASVITSTVVAAEHAAIKLVSDTTKLIKKKIKAEDAVIKANPARLYELVDEIVLPHFDFKYMSGIVLGKNWRKANKDQKQRFTKQFRSLLVRTYSKALQDNVDQAIEILPLRGKPDGKDLTVRTEVEQQAGFPIPIDYKMHFKNDEWKVYDIVIDSISLVINYRSSFNKEIKTSPNGIDGLIARLEKRNSKPINEEESTQ
ncbi:MAG: ABC transporter substrate-binding protein [Gammaproteobacteria bacterium]|nr:ABC transporter substrate-binding protein [Gammaproteobacteria bacterium]